MADITLENITKRYGDGYEAVKDLNLEIADGEFMILVGPSGCGKSTALRMVARLEDISGGQLRIGGEVVNDRAPKDRDIAMVFQNYALYPHMTVRENMGFALKLAKTPQAEIDRKVDEVAKVLDLEPHLDRKPANLSGGQRQRVAMGRAIVRDPKASSPTNLFVTGLVGSPSMNFLPGELAEGVVKLPIGDVKLSDEVRRGLEGASGPSSGRNVIAGLRPEHFEDAALVRDRSAGTGFPTTISMLESMDRSTTHISTSNPTASPRVSSTSWPRTRAPATSPTRARRRRSWLGSTQRARSGRASRASCGSTLGACSCSTPRAVAA
jgi:ABC-type sugar transport system ATPase subunit